MQPSGCADFLGAGKSQRGFWAPLEQFYRQPLEACSACVMQVSLLLSNMPGLLCICFGSESLSLEAFEFDTADGLQ